MIIAGLDTETTGLPDPAHRIIELHIQKWDFDPVGDHEGPTARRMSDQTWRFNPERSIDPKAQAVHHISLDDLAGSPRLADVVGDVLGHMIGVDLWVAHNADFDRMFMRLEIERVHPAALPFLDRQKWFDTMEKGRFATPLGKVPNLSELCWALDRPYDPALAHAAEYDVSRMMECFFTGHRLGFFKL